ncbi:hypothetical protein C8J57DRAFT_1292671 [Mycena rebaudengoi]|nr:hypothetical protein C8J57DRAFT_1292671 [Mycena rebaudengoi]
MSDSQRSLTQRPPHGRIQDEEQGVKTETTATSPERPAPTPSGQDSGRLGDTGRIYRMKDRFLRTGKPRVGTLASIKAVCFSSWLNILLVFIPIAWAAHFSNAAQAHEIEEDPEHRSPTWPYPLTFVMCFLAIIPLEKLFDYGGEQMAFYLGPDFGDLLTVTLNNAVEATLAIILLKKCDLKLLQSTVIGVVLLHLLLIPGVAFITGGARIIEQELHPHLSQLNHTLLTIGVMTLLLPAAFFAAMDRQFSTSATPAVAFVTDENRAIFLHMSRGLAIILLTVYICSRIYLHNPPGEGNSLAEHKLAPEALKNKAILLESEDPEISQWVAIGMLIIAIGLMAATAEWLVDSIEFVREEGNISVEWFGLILLPLVSFSADGCVAIIFFIHSAYRMIRGRAAPPGTLAHARPIDLSIQFTLFWLPFFVLLGWWTDKPLSLLFDMFEVALVISSCFIVNYVTADSKTNWLEGYAMLAFYVMIALCSWFYTGQKEMDLMLACESITAAIAAGVAGSENPLAE